MVKLATFTVGAAYRNDAGRGIARLPSSVFDDWELSPGDYVELEGRSKHVAQVWRQDELDDTDGTLLLDENTRERLRVEEGDLVWLGRRLQPVQS